MTKHNLLCIPNQKILMVKISITLSNIWDLMIDKYSFQQKAPPEHLAAMYNMADCTVNISDAEGFGLATLESLSCGTPIIVNMTGGLQEQVISGAEMFGVPLLPSSKLSLGLKMFLIFMRIVSIKTNFFPHCQKRFTTWETLKDVRWVWLVVNMLKRIITLKLSKIRGFLSWIRFMMNVVHGKIEKIIMEFDLWR